MSYAQPKQKGTSTGLGIASMVLGIISILLFATCLNYILGIVAIVLGIIQLVKNEKKGMAIAGIITAVVSFLLTIFLWVGIMDYVGSTDMDSIYNDYYRYYEENYDGGNSDMDMPEINYQFDDDTLGL